MEPAAEKDVPQFPVPDGWLTFGSLIDHDGPSECSVEVGEDGLPLWERVLPPAESPFGPLDEHGHDGHAPDLNGLLADCPGCVTSPGV